MVCPERFSISLVEIDERQPEPLRQPLPHRGLAGAHESGEVDRAAAAAIAAPRRGRPAARCWRRRRRRTPRPAAPPSPRRRRAPRAGSSASTPPIATIGFAVSARARRRAVEPDHRIGVLLVAGRKDRAERHHVDVAIGGGGGDLIEVVGRGADPAVVTHHGAHGARRQIVLTDVDPGQRVELGQVGAIVHPQHGRRLGARRARARPRVASSSSAACLARIWIHSMPLTRHRRDRRGDTLDAAEHGGVGDRVERRNPVASEPRRHDRRVQERSASRPAAAAGSAP